MGRATELNFITDEDFLKETSFITSVPPYDFRPWLITALSYPFPWLTLVLYTNKTVGYTYANLDGRKLCSSY